MKRRKKYIYLKEKKTKNETKRCWKHLNEKVDKSD